MKSLYYSIALVALTQLAMTSSIDALEPQEVFQNAVAAWHLQSLNDQTAQNRKLVLHGKANVGFALEGIQRQQSLSRGGDGFVASLEGGWLDAGRGQENRFDFNGDQFTACIRLQCDSERLWSTRGFFTRGGGHDQLLFNFFSHDFDRGREAMRVGCEIGIDGREGLGGQVTAMVAQIGPTLWHDYVVRYNGRELVFFVDGVALDRSPVSGRMRQGNLEPLCIGSGGAADNPFVCRVDHAAIWDRALSDDEVVAISGGIGAVKQAQERFDAWVEPPPRTPITELIRQSRQLQRHFQADPHRPKYHLMHFEGGDIMPGDPNGAIYWKGRYHLFYIFQRQQKEEPGTVHCWGHASSVDLVHWTHHPTALDVAPTDPDRGIFSGNALVTREGKPVLIYHGVGLGNCMATSSDDELIRWEKSGLNPLVPIPAADDPSFGKYDSWDPHVWFENNQYYAIFGGNPSTGAPPALFRGDEIHSLKYLGPFLPNDRWSQPGEDVSCPDFFPLAGGGHPRQMLLCISHMRGARFFLGRWNEGVFTPESHGRMNWPGGCFFAPETLIDQQGRRILWGWCLDQRPASDRRGSGATGVMSLPRVLSIDPSGGLRIEPVEELQRLRINPIVLPAVSLPPLSVSPLTGIQGDSLEVEVEFPAGITHPVGVTVRQTPDEAEKTVIRYDPKQSRLTIDVSKSTLDAAIHYSSWCLYRPSDEDDATRAVTEQHAPLKIAADEPLRLRVFLDRSMLEVFANGRQCMTQRIWPTRSDATLVALINDGPELSNVSVRAWEMAASNAH